MVQALVATFLACALPQTDTATFRDAATAEVYARARVRHIRQDSLVRDYRATVRTRLEAAAGRSRFARLTTLIAHESVAEITWRVPNDLKVKVLGSRARAPIVRILRGLSEDVGRWERGELPDRITSEAEGELRQELVPERPWFIPRALGDSVRLMGLPEHAALHPLGDNATDYYRFAITDSVTLLVPGRSVRAILMRVEPKVYGPSLIAGDMWIDAELADVVRFRMIFLGDYVWAAPRGDSPEDSARARKENATANRFVSVEAEVEYALIDRLYWMPYRQLLAVTAEIPWFINLAMPARAVTTFSDYQVNTSPVLTFAIPDEDLVGEGRTRRRLRVKGQGPAEDGYDVSRRERRERGYYRAGRWREGRWEVEVPAAESLVAYEWDTEFVTSFSGAEERRLRETLATLAQLEEELPPEWTGKRRFGLAWEEVAEIVRFNRVQGLSFGVGYEFRPRISFTTVQLSGRFGLSDLRPTGAVTWRRDGPHGRLDVRAFREVTETEPWTRGQGIGNSLNALFTGHDDADYYLASGGGLSYTFNHGLLRDVDLGVSLERHQSMEVESGSAIADLWGEGTFQPNPPVQQAWFLRGTLARRDPVAFVTLRQGADGIVGVEGLSAARFWGSVDVPFQVLRRSGRLTLRAGAMVGDDLEQLLFRLGGPATVRGYTYGVRRGREFWSAQLDLALGPAAFWSPVAFIDVGDTFSSDPLVGVGGGVSFLNGLVRLNLSKGLRPSTDVRFDLMFRAPR
ncbi:MAG: hypothetical protein GTN62_03480 [Gemmatimonadales bacterium]|nr:hypothetical protein [Gemmatimonadales bacterium]NIN10368.1 hypothetical protein [Gemmatimonadales bacterium]NIN49160.1 hypothetical protein [Gemmatimonadales bacterium]NIP06624.1 hypothetical protein [Gemmatimonadales bacterium]NIQ99954.1 hypothetical protein [Gemmatimonadales bacterium]